MCERGHLQGALRSVRVRVKHECCVSESTRRRRALVLPAIARYGVQLNGITWSHRGWMEGEGVSTSRVSPPAPLSISYGHVGCSKARAFPPPV